MAAVEKLMGQYRQTQERTQMINERNQMVNERTQKINNLQLLMQLTDPGIFRTRTSSGGTRAAFEEYS